MEINETSRLENSVIRWDLFKLRKDVSQYWSITEKNKTKLFIREWRIRRLVTTDFRIGWVNKQNKGIAEIGWTLNLALGNWRIPYERKIVENTDQHLS